VAVAAAAAVVAAAAVRTEKRSRIGDRGLWIDDEEQAGFHPRSAICRLDKRLLPTYGSRMTAALDAIAHDALVLPPDQRVALAYRLLVSVEPDPEPGVDAVWDEEIACRIASFDAGESHSVPAAEVFARLRQIAPST
jgi:hypothetical protein